MVYKVAATKLTEDDWNVFFQAKCSKNGLGGIADVYRVVDYHPVLKVCIHRPDTGFIR